MRLFIAIKIPDNLILELSHLPPSIKGVKRVPDSNRHITITFLGEKYESQYHEIINALDQIDMNSFTIKILNTGIFKQRGNRHILWAGVEKNNELLMLHQKIKEKLYDSEIIPSDNKNFQPHITLGRSKSSIKDNSLIPFLSAGLFNVPPFEVTSFSLYSSELTPHGAIYTEEETFKLKSINE